MQILGVPISNLSSGKLKYDSFSFSKEDTTAGTNIIYNVFLSNIYMLIIYELSSKFYHDKIYLIVIGYLIVRYIYILFILNRGSLLNIKFELTLIIITLLTTLFVYEKIIKAQISLKIPIEDFKNEIVLLAIIFLFSIFKEAILNIFKKRKNTSERKRYIQNQYHSMVISYGEIVNTKIDEQCLSHESISYENLKDIYSRLIFSIMIYENYSRPKFFRLIETKVSKYSSKIISTGIMQVKGMKPKNDAESIADAIELIKYTFLENVSEGSDGYFYWITNVCVIYNPSENNEYANEIKYIYSMILNLDKNSR
jgi:uncharacterized protein YfkK (UPF0435 family)